jgi:FHA domain
MSDASTYMRLEVISGNAPGSTLVVEDELTIGRHASGPGRLSEDEEISRQHARISREEATGNYAIEDLGSSNGTFVNGLRIRSPRVLAEGDSIETGATTLVVKEIVKRGPPEAAGDGPVGSASKGRAAPTVFAGSAIVEEAPVAPLEEIPSPRLSLEIDFEAREARIALGDGGETVRLVFADGAWRVG